MSIQSTSGIHNQARQAESNPNNAGGQATLTQAALKNTERTTEAVMTVAAKGGPSGSEKDKCGLIGRISNAIKMVAQSAKQATQSIHNQLKNFAQSNPKTALLLGMVGLPTTFMLLPLAVSYLPFAPILVAVGGASATLLNTALSTLMNKAKQVPQLGQA